MPDPRPSKPDAPSSLQLTEVASQTARHDALIRQLQGRSVSGVPGPTGPVGPQGPPGVAGPPGSTTGADANYVHTQGTASPSWTVIHNLAKRPSVTVVDTGDTVLIATVTYIDVNSLLVTFAGATSGKAYCN